MHTDAVQAIGQVPVDFAELGVDAMTVSAHKLGGPYGIGALVVHKETKLTPILHGGGQERDVRSGTLDAPATAGFAVAVEHAIKHQADEARAADRAAGRPDRRRGRYGRRAPSCRVTRSGRLPGNAHLSFSGCEGDSLLLLLDARGIEVSTGSACNAGVAEPSHVLLAMGYDDQRARGSLRFTLGHTSTRADVDAVLDNIGPVVERAKSAGSAERGKEQLMRVLAAMSGGVDSAVAAARMAEAGHDVVGVHLALSRNPQSYRSGARGCCTIEDSRDARRAADVIGIPFYVWDLAERFHADVVEDFVAEYAAGRTPNPCLRCNEKVKFSAVLERALALDFDAVATGHYARIVDTPDGAASCTARWIRPRTSRTCSGCSRRRSSSTRSSRSGTRPRPRCGPRPSGAGCRWRPSRTVTTSASLPTATLRGSSASSWVRRRATSSMRRATSWVSTRAPTASPSGSARACGSVRRPPTASRGSCWTSARSTAR